MLDAEVEGTPEAETSAALSHAAVLTTTVAYDLFSS
jgi:hypothetical protein